MRDDIAVAAGDSDYCVELLSWYLEDYSYWDSLVSGYDDDDVQTTIDYSVLTSLPDSALSDEYKTFLESYCEKTLSLCTATDDDDASATGDAVTWHKAEQWMRCSVHAAPEPEQRGRGAVWVRQPARVPVRRVPRLRLRQPVRVGRLQLHGLERPDDAAQVRVTVLLRARARARARKATRFSRIAARFCRASSLRGWYCDDCGYSEFGPQFQDYYGHSTGLYGSDSEMGDSICDETNNVRARARARDDFACQPTDRGRVSATSRPRRTSSSSTMAAIAATTRAQAGMTIRTVRTVTKRAIR